MKDNTNYERPETDCGASHKQAETNNNNNGYQETETPILCARGCGFFGSRVNRNLCSACYRDYLKEQNERTKSTIVTPDTSILDPSENPSRYCLNESSHYSSMVETSAAAEAEAENKTEITPPKEKNINRCLCCNKKVGVLGFGCRCGGTFCGAHRYPEKHECNVDYRTAGRLAIEQQNPLVKSDKMKSRI